MTKTNKILFYILITAIMCLCIGYAAIENVVLDIQGTVDADIQEGVFISDVQYKSASSSETGIINGYYKNTLNSEIELEKDNANSSITYNVTLYNNNDYDVAYYESSYDIDEFIDYNLKWIDGSDVLNGDNIGTKESKIMQITFYYKNNILPDTTTEDYNKLASNINFIFYPTEYQQVEYIESTGTQYILVNNPAIADFGFYIDFFPTSLGYENNFFGRHQSYPYDYTRLAQIKNTLFFSYNGDGYEIKSEYSVERTKINFALRDKKITFNNSYINEITRYCKVIPYMLLFGSYSTSNNRTLPSSMKLYELIWSSGGVDVYHFIPCYRKSDGEIGLYDAITETFFTNAGTGIFLKGEDV